MSTFRLDTTVDCCGLLRDCFLFCSDPPESEHEGRPNGIRECEASYSQCEGGCDQSGAAPSGSRAYRHGVAAGRVLGLHGLFLRWHFRSVRRSDLRLLGIVGSDGGLPDRFSKAGFFLGAAF